MTRPDISLWSRPRDVPTLCSDEALGRLVSRLEDQRNASKLQRLDGPLAWVASDFADPSSYTLELDQSDVTEIEAGLNAFLGK